MSLIILQLFVKGQILHQVNVNSKYQRSLMQQKLDERKWV